MRVVYANLVCILLLSILSVQTEHAHAQFKPPVAYEAVFKGNKAAHETLWYDRGKYAIQYGDKLEICDDAHPPARWFVDLKTKTARIDVQVEIVKIVNLVKRDGVDLTARKIQVDRSLLQRFAQRYRTFKPRNLDHTLWSVDPSAPAFAAAFQRAGKENVADRLCDIYRSTWVPSTTLWVDRSTRYVLKERVTYVADNPRLPPTNSETEVVRFRTLRSVDAANLQIPVGVTVIVPRFLGDIALPAGVNRRFMTGDRSNLGLYIKETLREDEQHERDMHRAGKAKKR